MSTEKRPETGPMRFGDDWPGVFIRGDHALKFVVVLEEIMSIYNVTLSPVYNAAYEEIVDTLRSCRTSTQVGREDPQETQEAHLFETLR